MTKLLNNIAAFFMAIAQAFYKAAPNKGETYGTATFSDLLYIGLVLFAALYVVGVTALAIIK
jgi:hypothetical protein